MAEGKRQARDTERQRGRAVSPLRGQRARNRESGEVMGGDAGGYRRDDKGHKDGRRDAHGRHRDSYEDSRDSDKTPDLKRRMDIKNLKRSIDTHSCAAEPSSCEYVVTHTHTHTHTHTPLTSPAAAA